MPAHRQNNVIPEGFNLVPSLFLIKERNIRQFKAMLKKDVVGDVQSKVGLQHSTVVGFCTDAVKLSSSVTVRSLLRSLTPTVQDVFN